MCISDYASCNPSSKHNTPTHHPPIMSVNDKTEQEVAKEAKKIVDENLLILLEENKNLHEEKDSVETKSSTNEDNPPIYFRTVMFSPEVPIKLDYRGKHVDMTHGPFAGVLMGLGQLNCSELKLKRLSNRHGILGIDKLVNYFIQEWLRDIKKTQIHNLLGGVGPMHLVVQFCKFSLSIYLFCTYFFIFWTETFSSHFKITCNMVCCTYNENYLINLEVVFH